MSNTKEARERRSKYNYGGYMSTPNNKEKSGGLKSKTNKNITKAHELDDILNSAGNSALSRNSVSPGERLPHTMDY
jgi:hypothetical protein